MFRKRVLPPHCLHFQEAIMLPLGQFEEKVAPTLQSHIVEVEREAQRWVGRRPGGAEMVVCISVK